VLSLFESTAGAAPSVVALAVRRSPSFVS